ncbi:hypothetical protein D3C81_2159340 [compost metagenome]
MARLLSVSGNLRTGLQRHPDAGRRAVPDERPDHLWRIRSFLFTGMGYSEPYAEHRYYYQRYSAFFRQLDQDRRDLLRPSFDCQRA